MNSALTLYSQYLDCRQNVLECWATEPHSPDDTSTIRVESHSNDQHRLNYTAYELGSASDYHQEYHDSNYAPALTSQYNASNSYDIRSMYQYNGTAYGSYSLNNALVDPLVEAKAIGYNNEVEEIQGCRDSAVAIFVDQYLDLPSYDNNALLYNDAGYYPTGPSHSQTTTVNSVPVSSRPDDSRVPAVSDDNWDGVPQSAYLHRRTHHTSRNFTDDPEGFVQSTLTAPSHLANPSGEASRHHPLASNVPCFGPQHISLPTSTHTANASSSPVRRKHTGQSWPPSAHHDKKNFDPTNSLLLSSSPYLVGSAPSHSILSSHHHPLPERCPTASQQRATALSSVEPTGFNSKPTSAKRGNLDKKQTLACLFCRERKIACGRPAVGSADHTCNQCARRHFKCEYPKESRRGQHKRSRKKAHNVNDAK